MENERYLWLVTKSIKGEITPEEEAELKEILKDSPEVQERYSVIEKFWKQEVYYNQSSDSEEALKKVLAKINERNPVVKTRRLSFIRIAAAAVVVLAIGIGLYSYTLFSYKPAQLMEKYSGKGSRSMITLTDGSRVWLNSDSRISYPKTFAGDSREVFLTGEAFFNVAADPEKPFYIHLSDASIKVVGTSFNVKAYSNEEKIQTSVVSGKVAFMPKAHHSQQYLDTLLLTKSDKVTYSALSGEIQTEVTNTLDDKAWINGKLIYKSETLESISRQLERSFGKKVLIKDPKIAKHEFTATFEDSSLNEIMYYLSLTSQFKYTITDSTLVIY
ncbi:FecR family protein [Chryseosolibacter indicus]|nr:FecR family protein [Chryseosolibacter indicus]